MSAAGSLGPQFAEKPKAKRDPVLAYKYPHEGITLCPSCQKTMGDETGQPRRRSEYDSYDIESCTGGCGRTIKGSRHT